MESSNADIIKYWFNCASKGKLISSDDGVQNGRRLSIYDRMFGTNKSSALNALLQHNHETVEGHIT
jgi:hypothetical protein